MLTGDRPTGRLHLGHYVGSLKNRVQYQHEYQCYFLVADLHMLTTQQQPAQIRRISDHARDLVLDALAAGIDPESGTFYLQSAVPAVYHLNTLLQNLVPVARLERLPTLKDMARHARMSLTQGLLGYPVLQAADILAVKGNVVPVGKDNRAHVEIAQEIARRFNDLYAEVFPVPTLIGTDAPTLIGIDGREKMSKSLNNAIFLSDSAPDVVRKVMRMYTDPQRLRADIPGRVEGNPVFIYHNLFNPDRAEVAELERRYRAGTVGDVEVKQRLAAAINALLEPMRERRRRYDGPGLIEDLLRAGTQRVQKISGQTLDEVHEAMGLAEVWRRLISS
jgi:tryptophanyl-tRNA synthetase